MSSIMDMFGGAAGGPDAGGAPMPPDAGAAPAGGGGTPGQPDNPDSEAALNDALDALKAYLDAEEDDSDKAVVMKAMAQLQTILGNRQKEDEAALGVTPAHKAMGRAVKSGGAGGGGY